MSHFANDASPRPCWYCEHWGGWINQVNSRCERPGAAPIVGQPAYGCAYFVRAIGADDETDQAMPRA